MSIETEFQSTIQNVQNAYNGLNNLGATIPQNKTIENIKSCLDEIYDNLPKTEYQEGTEVNLGKTSKGKLDYENGVVGIGQSSQDSTQGYNLSNFNTDSQNGISYNINTIKIVNPTSFNYADNWNLKNDSSLSGSTYSIYMCVNGTKASGVTIELNIGKTGNGYAFQKLLSSNTTNFNNDISVGTITLGANEVFTSFNTYLSQSVTANLEVKVMVVKGSYTTSTIPDFEPYTNGASPNPSYPQEIKYVRGKNLFNKATVTQRSYIDAQGVLKGADGTYCSSDYIEVYQGSIVWSATTGNGYSLSIYDSSKTFIRSVGRTGNNAMVIPIANGEKYIRFTLLTADLDITQIEEGTTSTPYLPYNTIEEVVSGKNECDGINQDYWINSAGTQAGKTTGNSGLAIQIKENTTYTISTTASQERYRVGFASNLPVDNAGVTIYSGQNKDNTNNSITITNTNYQYLIVNVTDLTKIQIEKGSTATPYEPYITPKTYQLSLGDIELNAIGNYKDELVYDVDEDKVYKNEKIGEYLLTGQETINRDTPNNRFELDNLVDILHLQARQQTYCNRYKYISSGSADYGMFAYWNGAITQVFIYDKDYTQSSDLQSYFANNETYFCYIRNTPILKEITDTTLINQVKALYNAHSLNGTTIITSNGNLPMIIKARGLKGE